MKNEEREINFIDKHPVVHDTIIRMGFKEYHEHGLFTHPKSSKVLNLSTTEPKFFYLMIFDYIIKEGHNRGYESAKKEIRQALGIQS